jgi:hypothetical protein
MSNGTKFALGLSLAFYLMLGTISAMAPFSQSFAEAWSVVTQPFMLPITVCLMFFGPFVWSVETMTNRL